MRPLCLAFGKLISAVVNIGSWFSEQTDVVLALNLAIVLAWPIWCVIIQLTSSSRGEREFHTS